MVTPLTTPLVDPTVATAVLPLVHLPPGTTSLNVVDEPAQVPVAPVMAGTVDIKLTVDAAVLVQPPIFAVNGIGSSCGRVCIYCIGSSA